MNTIHRSDGPQKVKSYGIAYRLIIHCLLSKLHSVIVVKALQYICLLWMKNSFVLFIISVWLTLVFHFFLHHLNQACISSSCILHILVSGQHQFSTTFLLVFKCEGIIEQIDHVAQWAPSSSMCVSYLCIDVKITRLFNVNEASECKKNCHKS